MHTEGHGKRPLNNPRKSAPIRVIRDAIFLDWSRVVHGGEKRPFYETTDKHK
ncbi:MAG: hypothetical protein R3C62_04880 [Chloroflexota bacterium]